MKKVLLISALLAFAIAASKANALTAENISITETGGIVVTGGASASGSSDANASVQSVIRSEGSNTNVRVDIQTTADGQVHATSVERTLPAGQRIEVRTGTPSGNIEVTTEGDASSEVGVETDSDLEVSAGGLLPSTALARFTGFFTSIFKFVFFFW